MLRQSAQPGALHRLGLQTPRNRNLSLPKRMHEVRERKVFLHTSAKSDGEVPCTFSKRLHVPQPPGRSVPGTVRFHLFLVQLNFRDRNLRETALCSPFFLPELSRLLPLLTSFCKSLTPLPFQRSLTWRVFRL